MSRIKDGNGRFCTGKEYFEDLYNIDSKGKVAVHMVALMGFEEVTTFEGSQLKELR